MVAPSDVASGASVLPARPRGWPGAGPGLPAAPPRHETPSAFARRGKNVTATGLLTSNGQRRRYNTSLHSLQGTKLKFNPPERSAADGGGRRAGDMQKMRSLRP